jgi:uncharacterized protein
MIRAVLDTNVVVSAILKPMGPSGVITDTMGSGRFRCYLSEALFHEYIEVLQRPKLRLDRQQTGRFLRNLRRMSILVVPTRFLHITADLKDNKIMECALEARADYVVTGNTRDFPAQFQDIRVLTPRQFLIILAAQPF